MKLEIGQRILTDEGETGTIVDNTTTLTGEYMNEKHIWYEVHIDHKAPWLIRTIAESHLMPISLDVTEAQLKALKGLFVIQ
jgi:hypothetical protein